MLSCFFFFNFKAKQALLFYLNLKKTCICYVISHFNRIYNESFEPRKSFSNNILVLTFLRSRKRNGLVCIVFCFVSFCKEANLLPIIDLISHK